MSSRTWFFSNFFLKSLIFSSIWISSSS